VEKSYNSAFKINILLTTKETFVSLVINYISRLFWFLNKLFLTIMFCNFVLQITDDIYKKVEKYSNAQIKIGLTQTILVYLFVFLFTLHQPELKRLYLTPTHSVNFQFLPHLGYWSILIERKSPIFWLVWIST